jgi:hypothetical protein
MRPAVRTQDDPERVRPIFVWLLAILVGPLLLLFGKGVLIDVRGPARPIVVVGYFISSYGVPIWFVNRARDSGMPTAKALVAGFVMSSGALLVDLPVIAFTKEGLASAIVTTATAVAIFFIGRSLAPTPPPTLARPDVAR